MNLDVILKLAGYGASSVLIFFLIRLGNILAVWLTQTFFPMQLKKATWKWEKEKWATELFVESLSRLEFIGKHLLRSEVEDKVSLSRLGFKETEEEIGKIITDLHRDGYRIRPYLSWHNQAVFDSYLKQSSAAYDASKDSYGLWDMMTDDYAEKESHTMSFVQEQSTLAGKLIKEMKIS
jgi:hypothetical protein